MIDRMQIFRYINTKNEVEVSGLIRIIEVDVEQDLAIVVNLSKEKSLPQIYKYSQLEEEMEAGVLINVRDPYLRAIDEKKLSASEREKREKKWMIISKYWESEREKLLSKDKRSELFKQISEKEGISESYIKRLFSKFFQRGMTKNALLPDYEKSGRKGTERVIGETKVGRKRADGSNGGISITPDIKMYIEICIQKYYRKNDQCTKMDCYRYLLRDYFSDEYIENGEKKYNLWDVTRIPSFQQFRYWFKKREDPVKDIIKRTGIKSYELKSRPLLSNSTVETVGPGTRFQVDATIADVWLVSKLDRERIIGRPIVYAIMDVYSRLITGVYVGLEGPSWIGAMMAFDNMVMDKVEFCKQYDIEIEEKDWPAKHIPEQLIADRGELEGYSPENLINNLNVVVENTSPYRGDLKGIVERQFRTMNGQIKHQAPGAIMKEYRKRGDRDYRLDATLNIEEFIKIFIKLVIQHNNSVVDKYPYSPQMIVDGIEAIPCEMWRWGIENKKGRIRTVPREIMKLNVLPKGRASISRAGMKFKGLFYGSDKAMKEQWFIGAKGKTVNIVYDPRDMNQVYIPHADGINYDVCHLLESSNDYKNLMLDEIQYLQGLKSEIDQKAKHEKIEIRINTNYEIEQIISKAQKDKKSNVPLYVKSKAQKIEGVRNNRQVEKELNRREESFNLGQSKPMEECEVITLHKENLEPEPEKESNAQRLMNLIKEKRGE